MTCRGCQVAHPGVGCRAFLPFFPSPPSDPVPTRRGDPDVAGPVRCLGCFTERVGRQGLGWGTFCPTEKWEMTLAPTPVPLHCTYGVFRSGSQGHPALPTPSLPQSGRSAEGVSDRVQESGFPAWSLVLVAHGPRHPETGLQAGTRPRQERPFGPLGVGGGWTDLVESLGAGGSWDDGRSSPSRSGSRRVVSTSHVRRPPPATPPAPVPEAEPHASHAPEDRDSVLVFPAVNPRALRGGRGGVV